DYVAVVISTDNGATWSNTNVLTSWNSESVIPPTGEHYIVDLTGYTGIVKLGFYAQRLTGATTPDLRFYVDNVQVRAIPLAPIFSITPTSWNFGNTNVGLLVGKTFTISNIGSGILEIDPADITIVGDNADEFSIQEITETISLAVGESAGILVKFTPTSIGDKSATLVIEDNIGAKVSIGNKASKATNNIPLTGNGVILATVPFVDNFEEGWGDWTVVNGTQPNAWYHGNVTASTGDNAVYISNDGGVSNTYNVNAASVVHFWQDIVFPADAEDVTLRFDWKGHGESTFDYLRVFMVETSVTPVAGTLPATGQIGSLYYNQQASWQTANVTLPAGVAGTTKRLVFTWRNDTSIGTMPAGAIDNVRLLLGTDNDTATVIDGEVVINPPGVTDPDSNPINPGVLITGIVGGGTVTVATSYAPAGSIANTGLALTISGASFGGTTITINHGLGFAPLQIAYRIVPGEWNLLTSADPSVGIWDDTQVSFTVAAKADGDLQILFPQDPSQTLPVELSSFTAVLTAQMFVNVAWIAESETNHLGYNVLRNSERDLDTAMMLNASIINDGTQVGSQTSYLYTDKEVYDNNLYYYWLESVAIDGMVQYAGPIMVTVGNPGSEPPTPQIPIETKLMSAYPNPFNPQTNLRYSMKEAGDVKIEVYNLKGQVIRSFSANHSVPGYYSMVWDGRDVNGNLVSSGVYFYRMTSGKYTATRKMMMMK
ncbi:MAG: choice-of-anchor D domain-containing protein, partial [Candidatus Cloacimonadaceae bacterium]|nr:choice-of-anchor D domain-containing protein [Candidatus Cloacimonadaceae bacterium]